MKNQDIVEKILANSEIKLSVANYDALLEEFNVEINFFRFDEIQNALTITHLRTNDIEIEITGTNIEQDEMLYSYYEMGSIDVEDRILFESEWLTLEEWITTDGRYEVIDGVIKKVRIFNLKLGRERLEAWWKEHVTNQNLYWPKIDEDFKRISLRLFDVNKILTHQPTDEFSLDIFLKLITKENHWSARMAAVLGEMFYE